MIDYHEIPTTATTEIQTRVENLRNVIRNHVLDEDDINFEQVEHFHYKQDLKRRMTVSSIVGLGFSLMSVPFGISTMLGIGLIDGGNVTILWGWVLVSILSLFVALSLGEIAGKYPTSGGVYHFAAIMATTDSYSIMSSWFTGWYLIMGNWTTAISILYGGAQFILSMFGLQDVYYTKDQVLTLLLYCVLVLICGAVNYYFANYLDKINNFCTYWTIYTVLLIDILLMLFSNTFHNIKYTLTNFNASRSGWPDVVAFFIGLQPAAFTLQGYGMILSMSDEVKQPVEKTVPKGMCFSILIAGITGVIFIIPILTILPELSLILDQNPDIMPIDLVFKLSTESFIVSFLLVILLIGTILFAGIGSLTTASRSTYAFARDGGLPYKEFWSSVDLLEQDEDDNVTVPTHTLVLSMIVCVIFGLLSLISSAAFNAFMGSAVISLSIANGIPILSLLMNKRQKIKGSSFKLGKMGWVFNSVSIVWIAMTMVILCMPPQIPITASSMNYSVAVCVVFSLMIAISYQYWGKLVFEGPKFDHDEIAATGSTSNNNNNNGYNELANDDDNNQSSSMHMDEFIIAEREEGEKSEEEDDDEDTPETESK